MSADPPRLLDPADVPADWLTVEQAIREYHKSERTIRRLLRARVLPSVQVQGPFGLEWRIQPPDHPAPAPERAPEPPGTALIPIADVERLMAPLLEDRDALRDELAAERAARLTDAHRIGELEGELRAVQAELERSRQLSPNNPQPPVDPPRRRWWQR